ncbi:hypothetical protein V4F39_17235 [Aquincola sp. MAHUQ-54]|uniref:Uncharacterized protein n=1 Tax=Aquincola agrisoli TaxID=3119538 RepID=A0AAW9QJV8_9BURK
MTNATRDAGNRRQALRRLATAMCAGVAAPVIAQDKARALREMQIHRVEALGLEIWVENHGVLQGFGATFAGKAQGDAVDVRVFIGQSPGRLPVAMQAYTLRGKLDHLDEPIRRSWGKVKYLA